MRKLVGTLAILLAAAFVTASAQIAPSKSADSSLQSAFDVKLIDVTNHVPGTVKLHSGDEVVIVRDPRANYCGGDLNKRIQAVVVHVINPEPVMQPVLANGTASGGAIVRSLIGNYKGTATVDIEITCGDSSGGYSTIKKTVKVIVH
ncbi:MAG TPA: hypothetical protein V6C81_12435 [Planktothrix sp.]|jgi:hypothetical protein